MTNDVIIGYVQDPIKISIDQAQSNQIIHLISVVVRSGITRKDGSL